MPTCTTTTKSVRHAHVGVCWFKNNVATLTKKTYFWERIAYVYNNICLLSASLMMCPFNSNAGSPPFDFQFWIKPFCRHNHTLWVVFTNCVGFLGPRAAIVATIMIVHVCPYEPSINVDLLPSGYNCHPTTIFMVVKI